MLINLEIKLSLGNIMLGFVIGNCDMITGFRLVGVEGKEVTSIDEALQALNQNVARRDLALIIVSEDYSVEPQIHERIDQVRRDQRSPIILELPSSKGKPSAMRMSEIIKKTLGVRL